VATIPRQDASGYLGAQITFATSVVGDVIVGGQNVTLWCNNTSGGALTVTLTTPETVEGALAVADRVITCAVGFRAVPVPARYNDPATGSCLLVYQTPGATFTVAAVLGSGQA
jgi:hypothetical protein